LRGRGSIAFWGRAKSSIRLRCRSSRTTSDEDDINVDKLLGQSQAKFESVLAESKKLNQAAVSLLSHYQ